MSKASVVDTLTSRINKYNARRVAEFVGSPPKPKTLEEMQAELAEKRMARLMELGLSGNVNNRKGKKTNKRKTKGKRGRKTLRKRTNKRKTKGKRGGSRRRR